MKKYNFTKMAGAGNDFVIIESPKGITTKKLAKQVCDRCNGIGADGLIVLEKSKKCNYRMRIINPDGSEAEMCGNGVRCLAAYIVKNKKPKKKLFTIETLAGTILAEAKGEVARVLLSDPKGYQPSLSLALNKRTLHVSFIDTGVPHAIVFVDQLVNMDVKKIGNIIRFHKNFQPKGTNVNFVEQINASLIHARTYERGVEDETKACGTGSVAAAIVTFLKANPQIINKKSAKMKVATNSGEILQITFDINDGLPKNVWLKGSAKFIAKGEYYA